MHTRFSYVPTDRWADECKSICIFMCWGHKNEIALTRFNVQVFEMPMTPYQIPIISTSASLTYI